MALKKKRKTDLKNSSCLVRVAPLAIYAWFLKDLDLEKIVVLENSLTHTDCLIY